jgi:hypothetical protein
MAESFKRDKTYLIEIVVSASRTRKGFTSPVTMKVSYADKKSASATFLMG